MIIRNPYNIVVKYYKIINLLLLIPMLYLSLKFGDIAGFFSDYIAQGYTTHETNFADTYVTVLTAVAIVFMLISNAILYFIFATRKKNNLIYGISVLYYIVLLIAMVILGSSMSSIERDSLDPTFANLVRDISFIVYLPIYFFMLVNIVNASGFNIKTFRFDKNADLKVSDDEDEIEIKVGSENNSLKKNIIHLIRELKYYILENKLVFTCIAVALIIIVGYTTYTNYRVYNRTYASNQAVILDNFSVSVKESYITNTDYQGKIIAKDKYYLAVKIGVENKGASTPIDTSYFRLYIGDEVLYPSYDRSSRFIDIAKTYQGSPLPAKSSDEYVFVYELNKNQIKTSYQIRILNEAPVIKNNKLVSKYRKINIRPHNITKKSSIGESSLGIETSLKDTTLGDTKITINSFDTKTSYKYTQKICDENDDCTNITDTIVPSGGNALVIIEDELIWDKDTSYYKNSHRDFYGDFVTITYEFNVFSGRDRGDKKVTTELKNITPQGMTGQSIYEVPSTILNAEKITMNIKIRNKTLTIIIKE